MPSRPSPSTSPNTARRPAVYRVSPFEAWRVERTIRRAGGPAARRFPANELVAGGFFTSACSPLVYTADLFPAGYRGNNFVCDPANNLVHREILEPSGSVFKARRVDKECEFLASTDNWFRPVQLTLGPDGAMYVLDFYREVIETPLSLPDDIKQKLNLESRGRGRIWRVAPTGFRPARMPELGRFTTARLAEALTHPNSWWRLTAQRLLIERNPPEAPAAVRAVVAGAKGRPGLANLLWTLQGLGALQSKDLLPVLGDPLAGNRKNALRLSEPFLAADADLRVSAAALTKDVSPLVRFQLALSAGAMSALDAAVILVKLIGTDGADPWLQTAALSSSAHCGHELIQGLLSEGGGAPTAIRHAVLARAAAVVGAKCEETSVARLLQMIADSPREAGVAAALLDGVGQGMRNSEKPLSAWFLRPPQAAAAAVAKLKIRFVEAARRLQDGGIATSDRVAAARLLEHGPFDASGPALASALSPQASGDLQSAAVKSLAGFGDKAVGEILIKGWPTYSPSLRRAVLEAMTSRADRVLVLLDAVEKGTVAANDLDPSRVGRLKTHPVAAVRARAAEVFKIATNPDRAKVVAEYMPVALVAGDATRGKRVFKAHCAACHKLAGEGNDIGPSLTSTLPGKSTEDLLIAVFDPNREVDPRYVNYQAVTADGRSLTGIVAVETPTSVTLRRADGAEDTVLRANLESLRSTKLSLMPEGFEKQLVKAEVADLFAFLRAAVAAK